MRALINYRVDPEDLRRQVPARFRLRVVGGYGLAGICLIRLERMRPSVLPDRLSVGLSSDNVAYRIAVEWDDPLTGALVSGVFIPRRDTSSALQQSLGGRFFPGEYHHSRFVIDNDGPHVSVAVVSDDGLGDVRLEATESDTFSLDSVFRSLDEASRFFEDGAIGYSARRASADLDGLMLSTDNWRVRPLHVKFVESSFFDHAAGLGTGSATLDNALILRDTRHEWEALPRLVGG